MGAVVNTYKQGPKVKKRKPHPSHRMTPWREEIRAPAGTERFYGVRQCRNCGEEEMQHAAGHFLDALEAPCRFEPPKAKNRRVLAESKAGTTAPKRQECLIHVYWSGLNDQDDLGRGHTVQRGRVSADLGLDAVPVPPFTDAEMQRITRAAKLEAVRCLNTRKKAR